MTATEDRLRAALEARAEQVPASPDPWAEHRRRVRRDRHRRVGASLTAAAAVAAVVATGLTGGLPSTGRDARPADPRPAPSVSPPDLSDYGGPENRPTSALLPLGPMAGGDGSALFVYWAHHRLCGVWATAEGAGSRLCSAADPGGGRPLRPLTSENNLALAVVGDGVASATYTTATGDVLPARIVRGDGFPAPVAVVMDRRAWEGRWHAYDAAGLPLPTSQPFTLDVRQVVDEWEARFGTCSDHVPTGDGQIVRSADGLTCYALAWKEIRVRRTASATAQQVSPAGSWSVLVELTPTDAQRFADLTGRVTGAPEPRDELAFVLDGTVLVAPSIQSRIAGGVIQLATPSMTERQARELAAELSGG